MLTSYDWCSQVDWVYWTVELSKLALQRGIHEKYARECVDNDGPAAIPPLCAASDSDSDDDDDDEHGRYEINLSECEMGRAGKSRERLEAESMEGPVVVPVADESADAQAH